VNYARLGNRTGARVAIVLGVAATAALIGLALWLPIPKSFPHVVIPMLVAWGHSGDRRVVAGYCPCGPTGGGGDRAGDMARSVVALT